jgi:hypothetical protein
MSGTDNRKHAQEIAKKVKERRREKQYQIMLDWRDGKVTGVIALDRISELETVIELLPQDFKPAPTPTPIKGK